MVTHSLEYQYQYSNMDSNLLVVQTGGTIDKAYPRATGGYAFEIGGPAAAAILKRAHVKPSIVNMLSAWTKDSQDITEQDRQNLAALITARPEKKIVITHGTDTIIDTAKYLADCTELSNRHIILTGSRLPESMKDSDADFNLGAAVGALQCLGSAGVYVAMNGLVLQSDRVIRDMDTGNFVSL